MSIGSRIVITITFQQVDGSPDTKARTEGNDECLQYIDGTIEKIHKYLLSFTASISLWNYSYFCLAKQKAALYLKHKTAMYSFRKIYQNILYSKLSSGSVIYQWAISYKLCSTGSSVLIFIGLLDIFCV